ncbi:MAG: AAA family ATPase [Myxococcota bacterium]
MDMTIDLDALELLCKGRNSSIYYQDAGLFETPVVVKVLEAPYPSPEQIAQFDNEYELTRDFADPGLRRAYACRQIAGRPALLLEFFDGQPANRVFGPGTRPLADLLRVAIAITAALETIHQQGIIHKDLNSSNILVDDQTLTVKIIDFGISTRVELRAPHHGHLDGFQGTLPYISPEQTGRTNRVIDRATDFYSLGVTFHELLTGRLPFEADDPMELVHCHIAMPPPAVHEQAPNVPRVLSDIVQRLLAKNAEHRYRSAHGLRRDLEECLHRLERGTSIQDSTQIEAFELGQHDFSSRLQIPAKLYGREAEVTALLDALGDACEGRVELALIAGAPGVGKSSLVHELYGPVVDRRGLLLSGKCDQLQRSIPYRGLSQAFGELVDALLTLSAGELLRWKADIVAAVGINGQVLLELTPALELVIGPQPPVPPLGASETQNRFNYVLARFVRSICRPDHPIVLFIDDLQWADSALLDLLGLLLLDEDNEHLLIVGTYRDNEVDPSHPLVTMLDRICRAGAAPRTLTLSNLTLKSVTTLVSETLQCTAERATELATLVHEKTLGNAFFVGQFVRSLHDQRWLTFDFDARAWTWDIAQVRAENITENVVELMAEKVRHLPAQTRELLELAACVGSRFDLRALSIIDGRDQSELLQHLWLGVVEGLILPLDENYRLVSTTTGPKAQAAPPRARPNEETTFKFLHDRVEQACYSLVVEDRRKQVHLRIGRQLLHDVEDLATDGRIFEIADHLDRAAELVEDPQERLALARLDLQAGTRAKRSTAYQSARRYLVAGTSLLPDDAWGEHYALAYALHEQRLEVEYLLGDFTRARALSELMLERARTNVDRARIHNRLLLQRNMEGAHEEAMVSMFTGLDLLIGSPRRDELGPAIQHERAEIEATIADRPISSLFDDHEMTDPVHLVSMELLANGSSTAYLVDKKLIAWVGVRMINLSLRHGRAKYTAVGCGIYGTLLLGAWGNYEAGYEFGRLGLKCTETAEEAQRCVAGYMVATNLLSWHEPIRAVYPILDRSHQAGLDAGELPYIGHILYNKLLFRIFAGDPLEAIADELERSLHIARKTHHQTATRSIEGLCHLLHNLLGLTERRESFDLPDKDEASYLAEQLEHKNFYCLCPYQIIKSQIMFLYGDAEAGRRHAQQAREYVPFITAKLANAYLNFYDSLNLLALCDQPDDQPDDQPGDQPDDQPGDHCDDRARTERLARVAENQTQMKIWADHSETNFLHKYLLVEAERVRVAGGDAMSLYDQAIERAGKHGFVHEQALANELAARYWRGKAKAAFARIHLARAHTLYARWGAKHKLEQLEQRYGHLADDGVTTWAALSSDSVTSDRSTNTLLDISSIMKAVQAMSQEVQLASLLDKMLRIVGQNAGADRVALVQSVDERLVVRALRDQRQSESTNHEPIPIEQGKVPVTVINYVARTGEPLVLNDALSDGVYGRDPYLVAARPLSVLCFPVLRHGAPHCILYLENHLGTDAFTPQRLDVLNMLSSQIAISLENADLYDHLEQKVRQRTEQLERAHQTIVTLEKQAVEQQMAGGFAHEMRNAISAADAVLASMHVGGESIATRSLRRLERVADALAPELSEATRTLLDDHLARAQIETGKLERALQIASGATNRALDVTRQILEYSHLGRQEPGDSLVSLRAVLDEILDELTEDFSEHAITVGLHCPADAEVIALPSHLHSILKNTVDNARDALLDRPVDDAPRTLEISVAPVDEHLEIMLRDNGSGISSEHHPRLFQPFFTTKPTTGTGLGLSLVSKLLSLYGGTIDLESEAGKGTTCRIQLPRAPHR